MPGGFTEDRPYKNAEYSEVLARIVLDFPSIQLMSRYLLVVSELLQ